MKILLFLLLFLSVSNAYGQQNYTVDFRYYTRLDGLANTQTSTAVEDDRGIVWIINYEGVTRFDGKHFKPFNIQKGFEFGSIITTFLDKEVLWLYQGTAKNQLNQITLFHTIEERFIDLKDYLKRTLPFQLNAVEDVLRFANGLVFSLQHDGKTTLFSYTQAKGFLPIDFLKKNEVILDITHTNEYWIMNTTNFKLRKTDLSGSELLNLDHSFFYDNITIDTIIRLENKHLNEKNTTYFTYQTEREVGVFTIDNKGKCSFKRKLPIEKWRKQPSFLKLEWDKTEVITNANFYYYPKLDAFLYQYLWNFGMITLEGEFIGRNYSTIQMFENQPIITNNMVYNFNSEGLFTFIFVPNKRYYPFRQVLKKEKISLRDIIRMKDKLYFNSGDGLFRSNIDLTQVEELLDGKGEGVGLLKSSIDEDILWITQHFTVLKYNTQTDKYQTYSTPQTVVWMLYENRDQHIWFYDYQKMTSINPMTGQLSKVKNSKFLDDRNTMVYDFYERTDNLLWLFTHRGILEFDRRKGFTKRFSSSEAENHYLPSASFKHYYKEEKKDEFWLASDDGLIWWQPQKRQYETFYFNHFGTNKIHSIYLDDYGFFWLSTENGIVQFEKSSRKFKTYYEENGITHREFNRMAHFQDTDGTIYFGGLEGVTVFHPKDFKNELKDVTSPKINIIEYLQLRGKTNVVENLTANFYKNKSIQIEPNDGYFTLKVSCSNYTAFDKIQWSYRIKEQDKKWSIINNQEFTVQKLPHGKYILQIKAIGNQGQFTDEYLEIPIFVDKPLYLKWWFWVLVFASLGGVMTGLIKWRTGEINRRNKELEEEVNKRTAQIERDKQTIEEQAERLLELDKTKSKFFANVSHELRTPITLIQGPIQSVLNSNQLDNKNFTLLSKAKQNTQNLMRLVNEILDLTKMDADKLELNENKVAFYPYLRRIISNFQSIADIQNIEFSFVYHLDKSVQIKLDEAKFEKILNNLLSNAFKFTPRNGQIVVEILDHQKGILITVKDNGRGIPSEDIPHVFNRFYQSKKNTKAEGGLGIGLSLSKEFIRLMDGEIWVESQTEGKNQGATFFVLIPRKEVISILSTVDELEIQKENITTNQIGLSRVLGAGQNETRLSSGKPYTVLLVEDNHDLRAYVSYLLSPFYNIITANNGLEAVERLNKIAAESRSPSLIISDVMMPIMDGFELLEMVKSKPEWRNIPFIMLTARVELKDKLKALRIGVDDYLVKPFDEMELFVRIENLLNNYEERQAFYHQSKDNSTTATEDLPIISEAEQQWLEKLETTILKEMNNAIFTVDYLAEALNESRNAFFTKVKQLTGLSPNQYIRTIRLQKAKELLETSSASIGEIAQKVGFQSADYFSRLFKKEFGKSPSDYLK